MLHGAVYTSTFDAPIKRDDKFPTLKPGEDRIPARVEGDYVIVRWP